jgi:hypothetical protein
MDEFYAAEVTSKANGNKRTAEVGRNLFFGKSDLDLPTGRRCRRPSSCCDLSSRIALSIRPKRLPALAHWQPRQPE